MASTLRRLSFLVVSSAVLSTGCSRKAEQPQTAPASQPAPPVYHVDSATAGSIHGIVRYQGKVPPKKPIDLSEDPACVEAHHGKAYDESILVGRGGAFANAFVYVSKGLEGKNFATPAEAVVIDQKGCWFHPHVLGVQVNQTVDIINSDPVTHNIHPMAATNRAWNHSQGPGDPPMHRKFTKPEVMIPVKCNIHDWMHAYIGVLDHPYFAVSAEDGTFTIPNLPPGTYTLTIWHEKLGTQDQQITISPQQSAAADFTYKGK
jgi:plastocyanin